MYGFTFDGVHCSNFGIYLKTKNRPPMPNTVDRIEKIPFRNGVYDFGSDLDSRTFEIQCSFFEDDLVTLKTKIKQISQWLNPLKGLKPLIFDDESEVLYLARYSGSVSIEQIVNLGIFTISFFCPDPLGQKTETTISKELMSTDNIISVDNNGNFETPTIIEIEGRTYSEYLGTFTRNSVAYLQNGTQINSGLPRYENGAYLNIITNGNANGTTGWSGANSSLSASNNEFAMLAAAQHGGAIQNRAEFANYKGHKLYFRAYAKSSSSNVYLLLNDGTAQTQVYHSGSGQYEFLSGIRAISSSATDTYIKLQDSRTSDWTTNYLKEVLAIDLTAEFGAGNEPTLATCDIAFATWFDGAKFGKGVTVEEGTTNIALSSDPTALGQFAGYSLITIASAGAVASFFQGGIVFGDNSSLRYALHSATLSPNTTYCISIFIRMDDGGVPVLGSSSVTGDLCLVADNAIVNTNIRADSLGSGLYRLSATRTVGATPVNSGGVYKYTTQTARSFKVSGIQIEAKSYPTSYMPTTSATATRAEEILTIPTAGVLSVSEGTVQFHFKPDWANTDTITRVLFAVQQVSPAIATKLYASTTTITFKVNNSAFIIPRSNLLEKSWNGFALAWGNGTFKGYLNGVPVGSGVYSTIPVWDTPIYIGANSPDGLLQPNGIFDDLRISSKARTDAEILADYNANVPLVVDNFTTAKMDCDGNLTIYGVTTGVSGATETKTTNPLVTIGLKTIKYSGSLLHNQKLIIDTDKMTMIKGTDNALALQSGDFPLLIPGSNTLTYSDDGSNRANVTIKYNERCL